MLYPMTTYKILVSHRTLGSAIHAPACPVVVNRGPREGAFEVEAPTAAVARADWDADNDTTARALPQTKICKCCR
jgi:hypothetical protein